MRATFAKWYRKVWTRVFDPVWKGSDKNFEKVSAMKVVARAEAKMLPFDDVDEWLAVRLRQYDHALSRIEAGIGQETTRAFRAFVARSLRNSWYRRLLQADNATAYTLQDAMKLQALLATS